jgi:hypothetical protein
MIAINEFIFNSIINLGKESQNEKKVWCSNCKEMVHTREIHVQNGPDDNQCGEILCAKCDEPLLEL